MRFSRVLVQALVWVGTGLAVPDSMLLGQEPTERKAFVLPHVLEALDQAIVQPAPAGLSAGEGKAYGAETEWLKGARRRIEQLGTRVGIIAPRDASTGMATGRRRQYQPVEIAKEIEALKAALERESRQFNTLSNASKSRHEIAMNAIRNMKA